MPDAGQISESLHLEQTGRVVERAVRRSLLDGKSAEKDRRQTFLRFFLPFSFMYSSYKGSCGAYCSRCFSNSADLKIIQRYGAADGNTSTAVNTPFPALFNRVEVIAGGDGGRVWRQ